MIRKSISTSFAGLALLLAGCGGAPAFSASLSTPDINTQPATLATVPVVGTQIPTRPNFKPGELVDYAAQAGDTLQGLAARFNTSAAEIMEANPIVPPDATTMPPGLPMKIPIYFRSLWGTAYQMLPDTAFVNGPSQIGFNTSAFVATQPGWFKDYWSYAAGRDRTGAEIVDYVASNWSVSPRLLLAILEYRAGALTQPEAPPKRYILDFEQPIYSGASNLPYLQLIWAANTLNAGYYGWRTGELTEFFLRDGTIIRPDPWQSAATVALQYLFSRTDTGSEFQASVSPSGFVRTYAKLFGPPSSDGSALIPGSLQQPELTLPYRRQQIWTYTGGPHAAWIGEPNAGVDFAPPCDRPGCATLNAQTQVVAVADGLVVRSGNDGVVLDLDGDGDERTGWNIFYLHLAAHGRVPLGQRLRTGDPMGYPSSEGGEATGTHIHIARKFNGEWIVAYGPLAFNLDGWLVHKGAAPYLGTLTRNGLSVTACTCSDLYSAVPALPAP
jgi:murein DD-endopeptidase MepM/ murein hydrolase activator NlpD